MHYHLEDLFSVSVLKDKQVNLGCTFQLSNFRHDLLNPLDVIFCVDKNLYWKWKKNYLQCYAGTSSTYAGWIRDPVQMMVQQEFGECWMCSNIPFWQDWIKKSKVSFETEVSQQRSGQSIPLGNVCSDMYSVMTLYSIQLHGIDTIQFSFFKKYHFHHHE